MKWFLLAYLLSTEEIRLQTTDLEMCMDTLLEIRILHGDDLWSGVCMSEGGDHESIETAWGISP